VLGERWPNRDHVFTTILNATTDTNANVRITALRVLGERWPNRDHVFTTILNATTDTNAHVRETTARTLTWQYQETSCSVLMELAADEVSDDLRAGLVSMITLAWPNEPDISAFLRNRAVNDASEKVRTSAEKGIAFLHLRSDLVAEQEVPTAG
ncbi:HEAT repeat domain-containing protein, partial [uncultured Streptomyces sp.]|uniref:HEAT repeat domain-containing protein n=1 Tax=uncultured Streptomyces sp. TaxID=174707 RepID=UPI00262792C0